MAAREAGTAGGRGRRRLALKLAVALVAALVASELALQAASLVARSVASGRSGPATGDAEAITILCVGDSHTYGLPLPAEQSYPAQLEVALQRRHPDQRFRVVNLGIPSLNSAFVANRLERQMLQLQPQLVMVWVGVNNRWNVVETESWEGGESVWAGLRRTLMMSRLFRLASIAWHNQYGHQYDPEERGGWYEGEMLPSGRATAAAPRKDPDPGLAQDLERMAATARSLSTPILFVSYPLHPDSGLNQTIHATGARLRVPVVDTFKRRERAQRDGHEIAELIDSRQGPHPSGLLYRYIVAAMVPVVEEALASWHGLEDMRGGSRAPLPASAPRR